MRLVHNFISGEDFVGSIFNLNIWTNISTVEEREDSPSCSSKETGNLLSWKQFSELDGDFVQIHSKCDGMLIQFQIEFSFAKSVWTGRTYGLV